MDKFTKTSLLILIASFATIMYERKVLKDLKEQYEELKKRKVYFQKYK